MSIMQITLTIDGKEKVLTIQPHHYLADVLRDNGYLTIKQGCDTSSCGLCTVLMNGSPILSCTLLAAKADGSSITTIDGVQEEAKEIGAFLVNEGVDQCGFCSPGFLLTVIAMKRELQNPTEEKIKHYLAGNLCRCSGYMGQLRALSKYMGVQ